MSYFYTENEADLEVSAENLAAKSNTGFIEGDKLFENLHHRIKKKYIQEENQTSCILCFSVLKFYSLMKNYLVVLRC